MGDLNGDGRIDLVAAEPNAAGGGAIKILFFNGESTLNTDETVTISSTEGSFGDGINEGDQFGGRESAPLGDIDNDGTIEIAILWSFHYSLYYMGFDVLSPYLTHGLQGHGFSYADGDEFKKNRELSILGWQERLGNLENEKGMKYPGWDDWDEQGRLTDPTQLSNKQ